MQLISHFKSLVSNNLVVKLSDYLGESEELVYKTIEISIGTLLIGIKNHRGKDLISIFSKEITTDFDKELDGFCAKEIVFPEGMYFVEQLFAIKKDRVPEMISNEICVKSASARAILNLVAMIIVANIKNENPKEYQSLLKEQYDELSCVLPRGVRLVLGVSTVDNVIQTKKKSEKSHSGFSLFRFIKK